MRKKWSRKRKLSIIIGSVAVVLVAAGLLIGNIFYNLALNPGADKSAVLEAEQNQIAWNETEEEQQRREQNEAWIEEAGLEDVYITSEDGLQLHGYLAEQEGHYWVISCHGYTGEALQSASSGRMFYQQGYSVLLPDARGHGSSEGDYIGMGWDDRLDVVAWINQILAWDADAQIVLYGISMGGATVMMTAGEELPDNVRVIVEDCGYASIWEEFSYQLEGMFGLPEFPVLHLSSLMTKLRAGYWLGDGDTISQLEKSETPMLFIHGDEDTFVPFSMLQEVYDAASVEKEMLVVEGAGHGESAAALGDEYWEIVIEFVEKYVD